MKNPIQMKPHYFLALFLLNQSCVTNESSLTVAFGSCNDPEYNLDLLPHVSNALDSADYMIWLGDNVYLKNDEWKDEVSIKAKYDAVFERPEFKELLGKSNHLAIWDDHDAGPNDCNSLSEGLDLTMRHFKDFWEPSYPMPNPKSYYGSKTSHEGLVEFFFLDNRSFKIPVDIAGATLYGTEQLTWLEEAYTKSKATVKIVLMGGQFLNSAQTFENVSVYPEERQRLIDLFSNSYGIPVVLTGDRHHGEISKLVTDNGKVIYDATASPLTAKSFPHHEEKNIYRTHSNTTETNHFGLLQVNFIGTTATSIDIQLIGTNNEVLFELRETL
jgi:alkaline phosphatase D